MGLARSSDVPRNRPAQGTYRPRMEPEEQRSSAGAPTEPPPSIRRVAPTWVSRRKRQGYDDIFRSRVRTCRVIYSVESRSLLVIILRIGHRLHVAGRLATAFFRAIRVVHGCR